MNAHADFEALARNAEAMIAKAPAALATDELDFYDEVSGLEITAECDIAVEVNEFREMDASIVGVKHGRAKLPRAALVLLVGERTVAATEARWAEGSHAESLMLDMAS